MGPVLNLDTLEIPEGGVAWPDGGAAYRRGYSVAIAASVVAAQAGTQRPQVQFVVRKAKGRGACLFHASSIGRGSVPEVQRNAVINGLKLKWRAPCPAGVARRGHATTRTVGDALEAEHGRAFADGDEYATWMRTRDAAGSVPWSTTVEIQASSRLESALINIWALARDGGLALNDVFHPPGAPTTPPIDLLFACGHFDRLLRLDSLSPAHSSASQGAVMSVSASAWGEACLTAAAAAIVYLVRENMEILAEQAAGGIEPLNALVREAVELQAARGLADGGMPHDAARDAAPSLVAAEAGAAPGGAIALLTDAPRLRRAVAAFLSPVSLPPAAPTAEVATVADGQVPLLTLTRSRATDPHTPFFLRLSCPRARRPVPPHRICVTLRLRRIRTSRAAGAAELQGRRDQRARDPKPFHHAPSQFPLRRTGPPQTDN
jgi:hypothetical protein